MKNNFNIINIVLIISVVFLFFLHFYGNKTNSIKSAKVHFKNNISSSSINNDIAYINVDSLLKKYSYYEVLESKLLDKQKLLEGDLNKKMSIFENEAANFQKKVQNNGFLSEASAQAQQDELMQKQQNLYKLRDDLSAELMKETSALEKQLLDSVTNFLIDFNSDGKYRYILNSAGFLYGNEALDITDTIALLLNQRFKPAKK
jgi:outer membrane protein